MSQISQKIESLSPQKKALLELKLKRLKEQKKRKARQRKAKSESPKIVRRPITGPVPLSLYQERLWFINQFAPDSAAYNIHTAIRLLGPLDVAKFTESVNEVIKRHDVLRSSFIAENGQPKLVIAPLLTLQIPVVDVQDLPRAQQEAQAEWIGIEEAQRPFDLSRVPLLRFLLLKMSAEEHVLYLNQHHIISDWWSSQLLFQEIAQFYEALLIGQPLAGLLPEPYQYTDFVLWERERLEKQDMERSLAYWRRHLAGGTFQLDLPIAKRRPAGQTFVGRRQEVTIPPALAFALKAFSRRENVTLFMTFTAAFKALLFRYTGQTDITLGTPLANRSHAKLRDMQGFLVTMLVLHTELQPKGLISQEAQAGDLSFKELVHNVRQVILEAYAHQDVPFAKLLSIAQPARDWNRNPLFQFSFIFLEHTGASEGFKSLEMIPLSYDPQASMFDMTLIVENYGDKISSFIEYNSDLFEADSMARFAEHFRTLMENMIAAPDEPIAQVPMLTTAERHQLLREWNECAAERGTVRDTTTDYPRDKCIHQLFEEQVARTPDAVAVVAASQAVTYQELNARANQLAHYLIAQGVGPDVLVGICIPRSVEMVIGILGILKAGGAYVPLDPTYPAERLAFMLTDADLLVVLTQKKLVGDFLPDTTAEILDFDSVSVSAKSAPTTSVTLDNLAYVIYTSGSTGQPKGVEGLHRGAVNRLHWMWQLFPFESEEICCAKTSLSFVDSVAEILGPLLRGVPLIIADDATAKDPFKLVQLLASFKVTRLVLVPSLLRALLDTFGSLNSQLPQLKIWVSGGEALSYHLWQRFQEVMPDRILLNFYGSCEVSADATWYNTKSLGGNTSIPIGRPIANTQLYILDRHHQPVPIGVAGFLFVGGAGLARGYLNRPQLTSEKFIPNPFGAGGRLYKTGDLCRYLPDGNIEFLGRTDYQVKIRGFRIELGEIEAVFNSQPNVREAVVVVREEPSGKRLVAYVVGEACAEGRSIKGLRAAVSQQLPNYMIPSAFVSLEAMPLTPNGKIDRRALPAPEDSDLLSSAGFMAPRDQTEQQLVHIWQEVLGVYSVGVRDSFFDLGGHSLLAVRLMAQIKANFGVNLPLATLFQSPTIEQLATRLAFDDSSSDWSTLVPIQPNGDKLPFFCVPGAGGNVIYLYDLARLIGAQQPFYGLQAVGLDGETAPYTTVHDIAAHYIKAMQSVQPQGPYLLGGHSFGGTVVFEMAQQLLKAGHEIARLIIFDTPAPNVRTELEGASWDEAKWFAEGAKTIGLWAGKDSVLSYEALQRLSPYEQLIRFKEELERLNFMPKGSDLSQVRGWVQVFKTNILMNYVPRSAIPTPITLFRAFDSLSGDPETEQQQAQQRQEPSWGWNEFAKGPASVISVPGDHMTMMTAPHIEILAQRLRESLRF